MSIPGSASPLFFQTAAAAAAPAGVATRSLRFNGADQAYLSRTFSSAGNTRTWTLSFWIKKVRDGGNWIFAARSPLNDSLINLVFNGNDEFEVGHYSFSSIRTARKYRDYSSWYHIVLAVDTTQATASNRIRVYTNGVEETSFTTATYPAQNTQYNVNTASLHTFAQSGSDYGSHQLADIYHIDGSQLDPTSFGAFDDNGVWQAAAYSGTYGTNGFHLGFGDNSTNAALGTDSSGNSNTFTVNNIKANNTANSAGFKAVTYTGDGQTTQSIDSLAFQPDFVWIKGRNAAAGHVLMDSVRGTGNKVLSSHNTATEGSETYGQIQSFNADGFTVEAGSTSAENSNYNNRTYVAWCWKAGGAASSNSDGTITSSVSASTEYGFSVVTFTGPASAGFASVGHGLGQKPKVIFCKDRDNNRNWSVFHEDVVTSDTDILSLNQDIATFTSGTAAWDVSAIDSSTFTPYFRDDFGASYGADNVAYCWAEKTGFSKFGTYTGNGNTSGGGPRVELGFKPAFLLVKGFNVQSGWRVYDSTRDSGGQFQKRLYADVSSAESTNSTQYVDYDDTGFDVEASGSLSTYNVSGKTYIYMAFAQDPRGDIIDSLLDVPTNGTQSDTGAGGEVSGNYPTFNPLSQQYSSATHVLTDGNLQVGDSSTSKGNYALEIATMAAPPSGKWYWEMTLDDKNSAERRCIGVVASDADFATYLPQDNLDDGFVGLWCETGQKIINGSRTSYGASATDGDVIGVALDQDGDTVTFYKNNSSQGSISLPTNMQGKSILAAVISIQQDENVIANFGQRAWVYSAPSNHKALCTTNLPTPTIADGSDYFEAKLYSTETTISGLSFSPDLVWLKRRSQSADHGLYDTVRGVNKLIYTNATNAQETGGGVSAFNSDGFDLGTNALFKGGGHSFVSWNWDAGSSTVSNTDGSITASVRANQTAGFSIVKYTGKSGGGSWGHGLSAAPDFILFKRYTSAQNWFTWFREADGTYLEFEGINDPRAAFSSRNNVTATSTTITLPNQAEYTNDTSSSYIAYCVSNVSGYSQAGFYDGNGSADGTFVFTNFAVKFLMIKQINDSNGWFIWDTVRDSLNPNTALFSANATNAEQSQANHAIDFLSNGFKARDSNGAFNSSSGEYAYLAFASNPFQANGGLAR